MTSANGATEKKEEAGSKGGDDISNPSDLEQKIIKQIEFYFGDANLPRDKFMLEQVKLDDGWIPMSIMLKFQRLAKLSTDPEVIAAAMKQSQLVEVDTTGSEPKLRRSPEMPLPELNAERRKAITERTIYCKGFPLDSTLDAVMETFNAYSPENINMRKYKDRLTQQYCFKGSVFATFRTKEEAQAFLDVPDLKIGDKDSIRMWQSEYSEKKKKEAEEQKSRGRRGAKDVKKDDNKSTFKKGATIHLAGDFLTMTREDMKEKLAEVDIEPCYIGYNKGDKEAYLRLAEEDSAKPFVDKLGSEWKLGEATLAARVLEGDEEDKYLKKAEEDKRQRLERCHRSKKAGKFNARNKRRNRNEEDGAPQRKKKRAD